MHCKSSTQNKKNMIPNTMPETAEKNTRDLYNHPYFGRLVMMGVSPKEDAIFIITAISGRSAGSQNRIYSLEENTGRIYTEVADPALQVGDPELTLYDTQLEDRNARIFAASNGKQTEDCLLDGTKGLSAILSNWTFEPDSPNFTPRISGRCIIRKLSTRVLPPLFDFAIHRRNIINGNLFIDERPLQHIAPGFGMYVCTYESNGNPLPAFDGDPRLVTIGDTPEEDLLEGLRSSNDFLVSLAVKRIPICGDSSSSTIWNKNSKV